MCVGNFKSVPLQPIDKRGHDARGHKLAQDLTVFDPRCSNLKIVCVVIVLPSMPRDFSKFDELSAAVAQVGSAARSDRRRTPLALSKLFPAGECRP